MSTHSSTTIWASKQHNLDMVNSHSVYWYRYKTNHLSNSPCLTLVLLFFFFFYDSISNSYMVHVCILIRQRADKHCDSSIPPTPNFVSLTGCIHEQCYKGRLLFFSQRPYLTNLNLKVTELMSTALAHISGASMGFWAMGSVYIKWLAVFKLWWSLNQNG